MDQIVTKENIEDFRRFLDFNKELAIDTETTGLDLYQDDEVFAVSVANADDAWYFDKVEGDLGTFNASLAVLTPYAADPARTWIGHNLKFDLHGLANLLLHFKGTLHDTQVSSRLVHNDLFSYSLDDCLQRLGLPGVKKDDTVKTYIQQNNLWKWVVIPGKKVRKKRLFFDKVPREILFPYACKDARGAFILAKHNEEQIRKIDSLLPEAPKLYNVFKEECELVRTVFKMERNGITIDELYCNGGIRFYEDEKQTSEREFEAGTGHPYKASPKLFEKVFASDHANWEYTEKGNPSFETDVLKRFKHPAAKWVLKHRNAKSRIDFFSTFLFKADGTKRVHSNFNSAGTTTGRFTSSEPNFQNITNDEENKEEHFAIRKAIRPPDPDYCIVSMDYKQQEYCLMLDYAGEMDLIAEVKAGKDIHQATADLMGVTRKYAKTLNFMLLYGGGVKTLAEALGVSEEEARRLKALYFSKLPKVEKLIEQIISITKIRGYVFNWAGRRYFCDDRENAYRFPNRVIQGGGADIMKRAMNACQKILEGKKSYIFLTVHDELNFYIHKDELDLVEHLKAAMEAAYTHRHLPLKVDVSHSWDNLGELQDGSPEETYVWGGGEPRPYKAMLSANVFGGLHHSPVIAEPSVGYPYPSYSILKEPYNIEEPKPFKPFLYQALSERGKLLKAYGLNPRKHEHYISLEPLPNGELFGVNGLDGKRELLARVDSGVLRYNLKQAGIEI